MSILCNGTNAKLSYTVPPLLSKMAMPLPERFVLRANNNPDITDEARLIV